MGSEIWHGFTIPAHNQSGKYHRGLSVTNEAIIPFHTNFNSEQIREVGQVMKILSDLARPQPLNTDSDLTRLIQENFHMRMDAGETPYFPDVVFSSILDLITFIAEEYPDLRLATKYMLATAGAEGIGALTNVTTDYLRNALSLPIGTRRGQFGRASHPIFTKYHRVTNSEINNWQEEELTPDEVEEALEAGDIRNIIKVHCIGEVFTGLAETAIQSAAQQLAREPEVRGIATTTKVLGPKRNPPTFYNRMHMYERILAHVNSLIPEEA